MKALQFSPKAIEAIRPLRNKLRKIANGHTEQMDDLELSFEIERQYGEELAETVCQTLHVNEGACLQIAVAAARGII